MSQTKRAEKPLPSATEQTGAECKTEQLSVRYAEPKDLPTVARLYTLALEELKNQLPVPYSEEKVLDTVLNNWACAPCILLEKEGIVGFYGLTTQIPSYSDDPVLGDYMLYILPEHRGLKALNKLADAAIAVSKEFKLPLMLEFMTDKNFKVKAKFMEMKGAKITSARAIIWAE